MEGMFETLGFNPDSPLLKHVRFFSFPKEVKLRVNEEQNFECDMCHHRVAWMGPHHIVPENALKNMGIKGKDCRENAVGLCSGEWGRGENSPDDCHEIADQMAIREHKFWHNGRFVDLSEIDPSTYSGDFRRMPESRAEYHKHRKRRHKHH